MCLFLNRICCWYRRWGCIFLRVLAEVASLGCILLRVLDEVVTLSCTSSRVRVWRSHSCSWLKLSIAILGFTSLVFLTLWLGRAASRCLIGLFNWLEHNVAFYVVRRWRWRGSLVGTLDESPIFGISFQPSNLVNCQTGLFLFASLVLADNDSVPDPATLPASLLLVLPESRHD